jgi:predicted Zn finger-like uncharacterized protein
MLIVCPSCATSYDLAPTSLSPNGRQVRCARCRTVWHAQMSHADKLLHAAAALAPAEEDRAPTPEEVLDRAADQLASSRLEPVRRSLDEQMLRRALDEQTVDASIAAIGGERDSADEIERDYANDVEAPPIVPVDLDREPPRRTRDLLPAAEPEKPSGAQDVESVAARRTRADRGALRWPLSRLQTGMLALALLDVILIGWRTDVVRALPQTASFYSLIGLPVNLRGLAFDSVATVTEQHEGVPILVVEGNVINTARRNEDVPRLKFILRNAAHHEIYSWTAVPVRASLSPGEGEGFRTRLASPPADARDVVVRFVNRRDLVAANR